MGFYESRKFTSMQQMSDLLCETYEDCENVFQLVASHRWNDVEVLGKRAESNLTTLLQFFTKQLLDLLQNKALGSIGQKKFFRAKADCDQLMLVRKMTSQCFFRNMTSSSCDDSKDTVADQAMSHVILGRAHEGMCQLQLAKNAYRQALLIDCQNQTAKNGLASCFEVQNAMPGLPSPLRLPDELWSKIFFFLDIKSRLSAENVCSTWRRAMPQAWSNTKSVPDPLWPAAMLHNMKPDFFCGLLSKCGPFCRAIDLGCVDVSRVRLEGYGRFRLRNKLRKLLTIICQHCPSLEELRIPSAAFLDEDLRDIFRALPKLKALSLEKVCRTPEGQLTGEAFAEVPEGLEDLRLHFAHSSPLVKDSALQYIADKTAKSLTYFKLCSDWDSFASEQAITYLLDRCSNLTTVRLGCLGHDAAQSLTSGCLEHLGKLKNLKTLYLWAIRISNIIINSLVAGCKQLHSLELHAEIMDLEALTSIAKLQSLTDLRLDVITGLPWSNLLPDYAMKNGQSLRILALNGLNSTELVLALQVFPKLQQLCLWNSVNIDAAALINLIDRFRSIKQGPLKLIASCYQIQLDPNLTTALKSAAQFSIGCYYDHQPCDLIQQ